MRVLLIWRFSHHARYFSALAAQSNLEMVPFAQEDLPAIGIAELTWLWHADTAGLAGAHIDRLTFGRSNRLRPLRALRRALHSLYAALACARFHSAFRHRRPDAIVVWNGGHWFFQAAIRAAREFAIPVFYCENGLLPGTATFDPRGVNFHNAIPRDAAFYRALAPMPPLTRTTLVARTTPPGTSEKPVALPRRYLFVPFQMNRDTQIVFNSPWIRDMHHLLQVLQTVIVRAGDTELMIVVKEHPSCTFRYDRERRTLGPRFLFASGNSVQELIDGAEAVITVNSTVGLEALLRERRVIAIGNAFYAIDGLALRAGNEDELVAAIGSLATWQPDAQLRHQFLGWLETVYCIPGSWQTPDTRHCQHIDQRLRNVVELGLAL